MPVKTQKAPRNFPGRFLNRKNIEQGILNFEVENFRTSSFSVHYSIFDIP